MTSGPVTLCFSLEDDGMCFLKLEMGIVFDICQKVSALSGLLSSKSFEWPSIDARGCLFFGSVLDPWYIDGFIALLGIIFG